MIKDNELPENCNEIWDKVSEVIKKGFDSQPVYNEKYLKAKINYYVGKVNTIFNNDKMPKEGSHCIYLSVVLIDSVIKMGKTMILKWFWKKVNTLLKVNRHIIEDIEISYDPDETYEE